MKNAPTRPEHSKDHVSSAISYTDISAISTTSYKSFHADIVGYRRLLGTFGLQHYKDEEPCQGNVK